MFAISQYIVPRIVQIEKGRTFMTQPRVRYSLAVTAFFILFVSHDATGQDLRALFDRLDRLE